MLSDEKRISCICCDAIICLFKIYDTLKQFHFVLFLLPLHRCGYQNKHCIEITGIKRPVTEEIRTLIRPLKTQTGNNVHYK